MSGSINKVMLIGRLGKDPEMRFTPSGKAVTNFTMATNEVWSDQNGEKQERTEWHRIVTWGKLAENCAKLLSKGKQVYVEGRLQTRQWDDKEGKKRYTTEVVAQSVQFLGSKGDSSGRSVEFTSPPANSDEAPAFDIDAGPDDIPF